MDRISAIPAQKAGFILIGCIIAFEFILGAMAAFTYDEGFAFFDPGHWNEEDLKIVIDALVIGLLQTANRTTPWILVQHLRFRGYADNKEHGIPVEIV